MNKRRPQICGYAITTYKIRRQIIHLDCLKQTQFFDAVPASLLPKLPSRRSSPEALSLLQSEFLFMSFRAADTKQRAANSRPKAPCPFEKTLYLRRAPPSTRAAISMYRSYGSSGVAGRPDKSEPRPPVIAYVHVTRHVQRS